MSDETRVERQFHKQVWALANDWGRTERAVAEGRDLAYSILRSVEPGSALEAQAQRWLDEFGRDDYRQGLLGHPAETPAAAKGVE